MTVPIPKGGVPITHPPSTCPTCRDLHEVEEAVGRQDPDERAARLVEIALAHLPVCNPELGEHQPCFECRLPWPCFTFIAATGIGDG